MNEKAIILKCNNSEYQLELGKDVLSADTNYYRPTEVYILIGDSSKARKKSGLGTWIWLNTISKRNDELRFIDQKKKPAFDNYSFKLLVFMND